MANLSRIIHYASFKTAVRNISNEHKRMLSKYKNNFIYQGDFRNALKITDDSKNKLISADIVLGNKKQVMKSRTKKNLSSLQYTGELIYGIHPVYLALLQQKRKIYKLFVNVNSKEVDTFGPVSRKNEILKLTSKFGIQVKNVDCKGMKYLASNAVHQGVCLDAAPLPLFDWNENMSLEGEKDVPLWLVLHEILDPMNVGAILRSAYYFGVNKVFITRSNSCKLSPVVSKASSGALEIIDIYQIENLEYFLKVMKSKKWNVVSTVASSDLALNVIDISDFQLKSQTILILGNEGQGVTSKIQELCENFISVYPCKNLHKGFDSLNVSVATGVILHSILKSWKKKH